MPSPSASAWARPISAAEPSNSTTGIGNGASETTGTADWAGECGATTGDLRAGVSPGDAEQPAIVASIKTAQAVRTVRYVMSVLTCAGGAFTSTRALA